MVLRKGVWLDLLSWMISVVDGPRLSATVETVKNAVQMLQPVRRCCISKTALDLHFRLGCFAVTNTGYSVEACLCVLVNDDYL